MAELVKRKKPCNTCGGWYNYKSSRNCNSCKKNKRIQNYTKQLESAGKKRDTARKEAKQNAALTYFSKTICKVCGGNERYVTSAGCMKCQKSESTVNWQLKKHKSRLSSHISHPNLQLMFNIHIDAVMFDEEDSEMSASINDADFKKLLNKYLLAAEDWTYLKKNNKGEYEDSNYLRFLVATEKYDRSPNNKRLQVDLLYAEFNLYDAIKKSKYNFDLPDFRIFDPNIHTLSDIMEILSADKEFQYKQKQESQAFYRRVLKTGEAHPLYELAKELVK